MTESTNALPLHHSGRPRHQRNLIVLVSPDRGASIAQRLADEGWDCPDDPVVIEPRRTIPPRVPIGSMASRPTSDAAASRDGRDGPWATVTRFFGR